MSGLRRFDRIGCTLLTAGICGWLVSCGTGGGGGGGGGGNRNGGGNDQRRLRVAFTGNPTGMFAIATDENNNEFTFFTDRDANGQTRITEANARTSNNVVTKASLDEQGRPVNLRGADGTNANVLYKGGGMAKVAVVNGATNEGMIVDNLNVSASRARKIRPTNFQSISDGSSNTLIIMEGLDEYGSITTDLFDRGVNPNSPLVGTSLQEPCLEIVEIVQVLNLAVIVDLNELDDDVTIDVTPDVLRQLEGTWELCARSDFPSLDEFGIENRLTFGSESEPYVLISEFDNQNVFSFTRGVTINYLSGTPVVQSDSGLTLELTPIYTATSLDSNNRIVVERRFGVTVTESLGNLPVANRFEINAALENGVIDANGVLTFDLRVIDLENADAYAPTLFTLSYVRQGQPSCAPPVFAERPLQLICPAGPLGVSEEAQVAVDIPPSFVNPQVEWFVFEGDAFFSDPTSRITNLVVLDEIPLRIAVAVTDASGKFASGECGIDVVGGGSGDICLDNGWYNDGECDTFCLQPDPDCDVPTEVDICQANGWYGDGECDTFCPQPDPDCDFSGQDDICAANGWYDDGECDTFCPLPDPDCDGTTGDFCAQNGFYGDGECDTFCPQPDPDCAATGDICLDNGWYGDYVCDEFCPQPDPDCSDTCVLNGFYGDGECDTFCDLPDPDCGG